MTGHVGGFLLPKTDLGRTDATKIVVKNGCHGSRVRDFSPEKKELFYSTLERWLGQSLTRL